MSLISALFANGCLERLHMILSYSGAHRSPYFRSAAAFPPAAASAPSELVAMVVSAAVPPAPLLQIS
jgi:hypothetical protein